jgi:23S rRNA pseudouridine1911/1915/1917 synthase
VAKTPLAHQSLTAQLQARTVKREYRALVTGHLPNGGRIDAPIGRHPTRRTSMAVVASGRAAITDYRVLRAFPAHTLLAVQLQTGRTHQIRVHLAHVRHPIVGDPVYGGRPRPPADASDAVRDALAAFPRQALHAIRLGCLHPATGAPMAWEVPMAGDLAALLGILEADLVI